MVHVIPGLRVAVAQVMTPYNGPIWQSLTDGFESLGVKIGGVRGGVMVVHGGG